MIVLSNDTTYPIFTNFLRFDRETFSLVPDPQLLYELRFGPAVALFLLISAVAASPLSRWDIVDMSQTLRRTYEPGTLLRVCPGFRR